MIRALNKNKNEIFLDSSLRYLPWRVMAHMIFSYGLFIYIMRIVSFYLGVSFSFCTIFTNKTFKQQNNDFEFNELMFFNQVWIFSWSVYTLKLSVQELIKLYLENKLFLFLLIKLRVGNNSNDTDFLLENLYNIQKLLLFYEWQINYKLIEYFILSVDNHIIVKII